MQLPTKKSTWLFLVFISIFVMGACSSGESAPSVEPSDSPPSPRQTDETIVHPTLVETKIASPEETMAHETEATSTPIPTEPVNDRFLADVLSVTANGSEGAYTFAVEIRSPDTGCEQYADWWEVVTEDGELIYRRILTHSHVSEQPFTRSGGSVAINADSIVIVRAHMHPDGYGGTAFKGSVQAGFDEIQLEADFAPGLESADPLPSGCAF